MKSINFMKNVGRFTPPKLPSPIYPQIVCTIYPPEITKSDLPSNCLYDLPTNRLYDLPSNHLYHLPPPPKIAKSDLPSNLLYNLPPTPSPQITKSALPSNRLYDLTSNCLYDLPPLPPNWQVHYLRVKLPIPIYSQIVCINKYWWSFKCEVFEHIVLNIKNLYIIILSIFRVHF